MSTSIAPTKSAEQLLKEHGLFKQPVDVEALAAALGIAVNYKEGAREFAHRLFGRQPTDDYLASLAGACTRPSAP